MSPPVIVILGATAVGKTQLSLDLAEKIDAEIINADSMQLYRGMDIGTAKVAISERRGIRHHMLDVLDVKETANVADYQRATRDVIQEIHGRGRRALLVGGSGLFIQAVLEDLQFPGSDPKIRERLLLEAEQLGAEVMYERLKGFDAEAASHILPTNIRRVIRALEVVELTGQAPTTTLSKLPAVLPSIRFGLRRERPDLDQRIQERVHIMVEQGLASEVEHLSRHGLRDGLTASKALGYSQFLAHLDGELSLALAIESTTVATRRFARRQEAWFNRDSDIRWIDAASVRLGEIVELASHS